MEPTQIETSESGNNSPQFELSTQGIPLVDKEGKKVESTQFKNLLELTNPEQAMQAYKAIKQLEQGEFKNSKLRDENNELLVVWHGSPRKFDEFKTDAKGEWRWRNIGSHFSSSREVIQQYSDKAQEKFNFVCNQLLRSIEKVAPETKWNAERFRKVAQVYNEIIKDLIENGENSHYYDKGYGFDLKTHKDNQRRPDLDAIRLGLGSNLLSTEEFLELFGGEMPTKENTSFIEDNMYLGENIPIYWGNGIGRYKYAAVLNIENPFRMETTDVDNGFEEGEKAHREQGNDGTILFHHEDIAGMGNLKVKGTKGTYSAAVFEPSKIKIIGRQEREKFVASRL